MTEESTALDVAHQAKITEVLEHLATRRANTIAAACELSGVARRTWYGWVSNGLVQRIAGQMLAALRIELMAQSHAAFADLLAALIADCNEAASVRDRNDSRRTFRLWYATFGGSDMPEPETGESAAAWIKRTRHLWQVGQQVNVQAAPGSKVVIGGDTEEESDNETTD